jgi:hypothetical protein
MKETVEAAWHRLKAKGVMVIYTRKDVISPRSDVLSLNFPRSHCDKFFKDGLIGERSETILTCFI